MIVTALILIALGAVLGLFFPVMFVAAAAGVVILILGFVSAGRRAHDAVSETPSKPS